MNSALAVTAAALLALASHAQGTVHFNTRIPGQVDAPVGDPSFRRAPGPAYAAELGVIGPNGSFTPIPASLTTFRSSPETPDLERYVVTITEVAVPGVPIGGTVNLAFRAWPIAFGTYDASPSVSRGTSGAVAVTSLGGGPTPPANLVGLQGFIIWQIIPEPSTFALALTGGAILFLLGTTGRRNFRPL